MSIPPSASVPQRLWADIEVPPIGALEASARVSVLLDGTGDPAPTMTALASQGYPADLVEVLDPAAAVEPAGDVIVALAAGTVPQPGFLEAHARWHHTVADAVSLGPVEDPGGGGSELALVRDLTRDLTDLGGGIHLAAAEDTFAVRRELFLAAGGAGDAPAEVRRLDIAQRLDSAGAVFVPEPDARAKGPGGAHAAALARACERGEALEIGDPQLAAHVALPPFREAVAARRHLLPAAVVNIAVGEETASADAVATIRGVLASHFGDLELRIQLGAGEPRAREIERVVAGDDRARVASSSLDEGTAAPFQVTVPATAALDPRTLGDLQALALGEEVGALHVTVPGIAPQDAMIEVVATGAWRRSRRLAEATGEALEAVLGRLFGERWVSGVEVSTRAHGVDEPQVTEHGPLAAATDLDHERNAHLRFRARADDHAERSETLARRTLAERLRARAERLAAERIEARLRDGSR